MITGRQRILLGHFFFEVRQQCFQYAILCHTFLSKCLAAATNIGHYSSIKNISHATRRLHNRVEFLLFAFAFSRFRMDAGIYGSPIPVIE